MTVFLPTRIARHGQAFTRSGKITLKMLNTKKILHQLKKLAIAMLVKIILKAYIRHLITCDEMLGGRLLSIHNIRFLIKLTEELREAIKKKIDY